METLDELIKGGSDLGRPFWTALSEGRLDLPFCNACKRAFFYPRAICPACWSSDLGWMTASGRGTAYTFAVAHVPFQGLSKEDLPFASGLVDLEEGVRLPVRFDADRLPAVGQAVQCTFAAGPGQFPVFLPVEGTPA